MESTSLAFLFPFSAMFLIRIRFSEEKAVSVAEKYADIITQTDHYFGTLNISEDICTNNESTTPIFIASYEQNNTTHDIICLGNVNWGDTTANDADDTAAGYPNGKTVECYGTLISITGNGAYHGGATSSYITSSHDTCSYNGNTWQLQNGTECLAPDNSSITF